MKGVNDTLWRLLNRGQFWPSCVVIACICVWFRQSRACRRYNLSPVWARITNFGSEVQNTLVKESADPLSPAATGTWQIWYYVCCCFSPHHSWKSFHQAQILRARFETRHLWVQMHNIDNKLLYRRCYQAQPANEWLNLKPYNKSIETKPANIVRNKYVIITSKRRFDVIISMYYVVCLLGNPFALYLNKTLKTCCMLRNLKH